jgi:hypothetical protein
VGRPAEFWWGQRDPKIIKTVDENTNDGHNLRFPTKKQIKMEEAVIQPSEKTLAKAMNNEVGIERDMVQLGKLVREKLFYIIIHDLKDESTDVLGLNGEICKLSIQYFLVAQHRSKITNGYIMGASEIDFKEYLRFMWNKGLSTKGKGNIRRELSQEKSSVYAAISEAFKSKFV